VNNGRIRAFTSRNDAAHSSNVASIDAPLISAGYFLFVKANQPELQAEIAHAFGDDSPARGP
jgi:hypothetical protein